MNEILLAKIRDDINKLEFNLQALSKGLTFEGDQNCVLGTVNSLLSSSAEVVERIREGKEKGEKADLYTVYSCSMRKKLVMNWHECYAPY